MSLDVLGVIADDAREAAYERQRCGNGAKVAREESTLAHAAVAELIAATGNAIDTQKEWDANRATIEQNIAAWERLIAAHAACKATP